MRYDVTEQGFEFYFGRSLHQCSRMLFMRENISQKGIRYELCSTRRFSHQQLIMGVIVLHKGV